jgi:hypothetical protein
MGLYRLKAFTRSWWSAGALALLVFLQTAPPVWAWGRLGHRVIARMAERHMTAKAKEAVKALLAEGESLADCSTWADIRESAPWHYVDVPLDEPKYDARFSAPDAKHGCIVEKIKEFKTTVKDTTKSVEDRRFAIRFLVHLVEDLHIPMHVGDNHDPGGNDTQVRFFDSGSNMHGLWDSDMITRAGDKEEFWLADLSQLDTDQNRPGWMAGTVEEWATESLLAARAAYLVPGTEQRLKPGQKLSEAYFVANLPVARQRLCQAGLRLAMVLNEAFPEK